MKFFLINLFVNFFSLWPYQVQKKILESSGISNQPLQFNLENNSIWVAYKIKNKDRIYKLLPPDLELTPIKPLHHQKEEYLIFFNFFKVNADLFKGHRLEIVTTALDKKSDKKRFIILDYYSDTISSDPKHPFKTKNSKKMNLSDFKSHLFAKLDNDYIFMASKKNESNSALTDQFSIECNENIYYGHNQLHAPNSLQFNKEKIKKIRLLHEVILYNKLWNDTIEDSSLFSFYYPHSLDFSIIPNKNNSSSFNHDNFFPPLIDI